MASIIVVNLVLGCALLGGYASMFTSYRYGYFDALRICVSSIPHGKCILDMSNSITWRVTGIVLIDDLINILLEFFSQGLRSNPELKGIDLEALLAFVYLAAQFGGAWYIITLEGLRQGNRGTILSWTGTFGIAFQAVTITIIAPIYLTLQLLGSSSNPRPEALLVEAWDLGLLPFSSTLAYVVPTTVLCLPLLNIISGEAKLLAIIFWQPFPLYHTIIRGLSQILCRKTTLDAIKSSTANVRHCRQALRRSNRVIAVLSVVVHLAVMGLILVSTTTNLVSQMSGHHILALTSLEKHPMKALLRPPVPLIESRQIVVSFLRWDVYCTCAAMLIWSAYQRHTMRGSPGLFVLGIKAVFYTLVGGPIFPALMFLWERDEMALDIVELVRKGNMSLEASEVQGGIVMNEKSKKRMRAQG